MARHVIDYDPITGITQYFDYDHAIQKIVLTSTQDVSKALDFAAELRADEDRTKYGIKADFVHYAIIPPLIQMEMKTKHGVDFWKKEDDPRTYRLINDEYARFKVTNITHNCKHGR